MPYAPGAKGVRDGGVSAAAAGDTSIAAITAWSRLRRVVPGTCVVPLDGVAPSDATVGDLSYPEAFPVTYLRPRFAIDAYDRALYAAMAALFRSERFAGAARADRRDRRVSPRRARRTRRRTSR